MKILIDNNSDETIFVNRRANNMLIARIKRGLSQTQMARMLDTSQPTYSRIESGATEYPDPNIMRKIGATLKIDPNRLRRAARL
jgi:transcriptional regulator with XRE-family HTH domain